MAIVEFTTIPLGTASTSLSAYVAECHKVVVNQSLVKYQLTPMSTILEGELRDVLELIEKVHQVPFEHGVGRVSTSIKIDDRRDKQASMNQKLASVRAKLSSSDDTK